MYAEDTSQLTQQNGYQRNVNDNILFIQCTPAMIIGYEYECNNVALSPGKFVISEAIIACF